LFSSLFIFSASFVWLKVNKFWGVFSTLALEGFEKQLFGAETKHQPLRNQGKTPQQTSKQL